MSHIKKNRFYKLIFVFIISISGIMYCSGINEKNLPVKNPENYGAKKIKKFKVSNNFSINTMLSSVKDGNSIGLLFDMSNVLKTLNNKKIDPKKIYGKIYAGPYPFEHKETSYAYKRFRSVSKIVKGKSYINISYLLIDVINSESWTDSGSLIAKIVLFEAKEGEDKFLGNYEIRLDFLRVNNRFIRIPSVIEGPMINLVNSDDPSSLTISYKTSSPVKTEVIVQGIGSFPGSLNSVKNEVKITGLKADSEYNYSIKYGNRISGNYKFKTAPSDSTNEIVFAYTGDSRGGIVDDDSKLMGVNYRTFERLGNIAYNKGASLIIQGGDMINGYTSSVDDFRTQIHSWKNSIGGFWRERPVYTCIGNHEALLNEYRLGLKKISLDKWPYSTDSAEAVFADELVHFKNCPERSDKRRPTYSENVYSFRFGFIKFIVFNNNYWRGGKGFGGSPEGYIFDDQMKWIENELNKGNKNPAVKYIILFAQEAVFPNGGHVKDSMWYYGNNKIRGSHFSQDKKLLIREKKGIIDVRNGLVSMIAASPKVAAVLGADEHAYHKVLIDKEVPIGKPGERGDFSPLKHLRFATWYIVSGGAGAPYYSEESTPWNEYWKKNRDKIENNWSEKGCYYYSSQENIFIFKADRNKISMTVFNPYGEKIDHFKDLMLPRKK